jgi:hypothetical protein
MSLDEKQKLIAQLIQFQSDYYTRGRAQEACNILTSSWNKLHLKNKAVIKRIESCCENLKNCEAINDLNEYANTFGSNLIQLIIILNQV